MSTPPPKDPGGPISGEDPTGLVGQDGSTAVSPEKVTADLEDSLDRKIADSLEGAVPRASRDPFLGKVFLGKYRVDKKLGEGGMGAVYLAWQDDIRRHVAVKVLSETSAESELMLKRFHVEAMAVSRLAHPHTIRIYDFGRAEPDTLFIVMEYLEGTPLNSLMRKQRQLPVLVALKIAKEIADSLREAHDKGIVHRDLKPENVFLVKVGDDALYTKVLDFGVAKMKEVGKVEGTLTQAGMIFGTPRYMSPEQATAADVDHRTDLYALGCMLYEMLTGTPPFKADTPIALLFKHVHEPPRPFVEVRPDLVIPEAVETLVMRLLRKRVEDRPVSMKAFLDDLVDIVDRLPEDFFKVIHREGAEAQSVLAHLASMPSVPATVLDDELVRTEQRSPSELLDTRKPRSRGWAFLAAAGATLLIAGVVLAARVFLSGASPGPLPQAFLPLVPEQAVAGSDRPLPAGEEVRLALRSSPPDASVRLGGRVVARTPLVWVTLRQPGESLALAFSREGYRPYEGSVPLASDGVVDVELESLTPEPREAPRVAKPGGAPAAVAPVVEVTKKPVDFTPGKVRDTKASPY